MKKFITILSILLSFTSCTKDIDSKVFFFITGEEYKSWESDGHYYLLFSNESDTLRIDAKVDSLIALYDATGEAREIYFELIGDSVNLRYWFYK